MRSGNVGKVFPERTLSAQMLTLVLSLALVSCVHRPPATRASAPQLHFESFAESDSANLALAIERACRSSASRSSCFESSLAGAASSGRVRLAMGALGQLGAKDREVKMNGHVYAHAIGIAAGKGIGDIAHTFNQCSESYQSGCYHGVIQARFAALDTIGPKEVNGICDPFRLNESQRWIRFQCVHGVGHGLTTLNAHDLPKGLAGCDMLADSWDRQSCYGGAFMENIINVTHPHHPANALAHNDAKAQHHSSGDEHADMEGMDHGNSKPFKPIDPTDQLYPCSVLGDQYQSSCYQMQTSVMLYNNKGDLAATARGCDRAAQAMIAICYTSLGRDISSLSMQNHATAIRMCSLGTVRYQPWCYFGVVKNIVDLNARPADGISLCRDVPLPNGKLLCYVAVGEQVALLAKDLDERRWMCALSEAGLLDACLFGARVRTDPLPGLSQIWADAKAR